MNEMRLVRELSAQISEMILPFVQQHGYRPTVVFVPPAMAHDVYSEMLCVKFEPGMPPSTDGLFDMLVMANAGGAAPELASIDLYPHFQPARLRAAPENDTLH
ncbi:hypothetical protein [Paraburkholderia acidisoli]|uniref:Uncharacterized protein n=1 Tax=Paraburkholderia acidisoli TaxID=2571748 RepID=A0A7Z2GM68_9BURK|nr:hypothetical protein [Paraburkholderia acidisoli]QGZ64377.1 hypothetical protein FAZ98_21900 [Paraburkholderia acidisoli]